MPLTVTDPRFAPVGFVGPCFFALRIMAKAGQKSVTGMAIAHLLPLQMPTSMPHATQRVLAMPFAASSVRSCLGPAGFGGFRRKGWYSYM
jgi:hypothetical protein